MADKSWKALERRVAKFFGCTRSGPGQKTVRNKTGSDTTHEDLYIEIKQRSRIAVVTLLKEVFWEATKENKTPVVVFQQKGDTGFYILVHSSDLLTVAGKV